ncbi:MAG TPA: beta-glucosidase BglX [Opitutaceae bacterium]|nr:beta-glucosidase BglX [Opitutaceae bacterium]
MIRLVTCSIVASALYVATAVAQPASPTPSTASIDARVHDLLSRMTLEEKVGQLVQVSSRKDMTGPASSSSIDPELKSGGVGSMLNIIGAEETRKWQQEAVESSRLHIPLLFGLDVIHGFRTIFPIPLGSAASWDLARIEHAERIAATEASAAGIHWTFAPMVDIARDPRWGRMSEGAGEDPYLGSAIARARVHGFQGDDLSATDTILACAKHFAAYGAAQAGRDYYTTDVSERTLREVYLPPFHAAEQAGVATFMAAFNDLDGTPSSANSFLMTEVLRHEWGFKGFVVSDWSSIAELQKHGIAANLRDAGAKAFLAGLDMDMESNAYGPYLAGLVKSGVVPMSRLDEAVSAVLRAKFELGLFDDPYRYSDVAREKATLLKPEFLAAAQDLARRSCVLLKNDHGLLPLATGTQTVGLIGPLADAPLDQLGAWHCVGQPRDSVTLRAALQTLYPGSRLRYAEGCKTWGSDTSGFAEARQVAKESDVVIMALGEQQDQSGEASSRAVLDLSGPQADLLKEVHAAGKPIILVLMAGRPLTIEPIEPLVDAIVMAWHPGTMAGPGIADVLTGKYDPAGHLPVTWPRSVGQIPIFYAHKNSGRPEPIKIDDRYYSHYLDMPNSPLYPFGYGLSYTTFDFDHLRLSSPSLGMTGAPLTITVRVRNTGQRTGEDVVQLYVHDLVGSVTRPVRELKGFTKIELKPGEARDVSFQLTPADLSFWRANMTFGPEPGNFDVFVGDSSTASLSASFALESPR